MPRAQKSKKPMRHDCCPSAVEHLRITSFCGRWTWGIRGVGEDLVKFCPWCGDTLPAERESHLTKEETDRLDAGIQRLRDGLGRSYTLEGLLDNGPPDPWPV